MTAIRFAFLLGQLLSTGAAVAATYAARRAAVAVGGETPLRRRAHHVVGILAVLQLPTTLLDLARPSAQRVGHTALVELLLVAVSVVVALAAIGLLAGAGKDRGDGLVRLVLVGSLIGIALPAVPTGLAGATVQGLLDPAMMQAHALGGSIWVGGLVFAALLVIRAPKDDSARRFWPPFWSAFSRLATIALGVIAVSGAWLAWTRVGSPGSLVSTTYGRTLLVKLVLVTVLLALGGINQRVLIPGIERARTAGDDRGVLRIAVDDFRKAVVAEAALGIGVIAVVPFLTGSGREQEALANDVPYAPAVLDWQVAALGLAGTAVMITLLWAASRGPRIGSSSEGRRDGPEGQSSC